MKKILFIIFVSVIINSCKKDSTSFTNLTGTWEMVRAMSIFNDTTFATGQGNLLQFSAGNNYKKFSNHQQVEEGRYRILEKDASKFNKTFDAIYFGENDFVAIQIKGDSLTLSTPPNDSKGNMIMDGGVTIYIKQK